MRLGILRELILYRYRYLLAYSVLIVICASLTLWQLANIPPGFSKAEMDSAVTAAGLGLDSSFVNGPYIALQKASLAVFDVGTYGVRIPSVICAILMVIAAYIFLKRWFKENLAIIGTLLIITSAHFLLRSRTGSPDILLSLWPMLLLATGSLVIDRTKAWKFWFWTLFVIMALMLYTPFLVYGVVIMLLALFVSPAGRQLLFEAKFGLVATSLFTFLVLAAPLGWSIYNHPEIISTLLGITESWPNLQMLGERAAQLGKGFIDVLHPKLGEVMLPFLSIPALLLSLYGFIRLCWNIRPPRHLLVVSWFTLATAVIVIMNAPLALLFTPLFLLTIYGFYYFIRHWYELFPRNPYARIAALLPIAALLFVMIQFNYERYFYGLAHSPEARTAYNADLLIAKAQLTNVPPLQSGVIVVPASEQAFFGLLKRSHATLSVVTPDQLPPDAPAYLVSTAAPVNAPSPLTNRSLRFITNSSPSADALRFRLYR